MHAKLYNGTSKKANNFPVVNKEQMELFFT